MLHYILTLSFTQNGNFCIGQGNRNKNIHAWIPYFPWYCSSYEKLEPMPTKTERKMLDTFSSSTQSLDTVNQICFLFLHNPSTAISHTCMYTFLMFLNSTPDIHHSRSNETLILLLLLFAHCNKILFPKHMNMQKDLSHS